MNLEKVRDSLQAVAGVKDIHHMHTWTITSGLNIFSTHILIDDLSKTQDTLREATRILNEQFDFYFSTIQLEKECVDIEEAKDIDITKKERQVPPRRTQTS